MSDPKPYAPILIEHEDAVRYRIDIRGHRLTVDQPLGYGGDAGPSPTELLGAALGGCAAYYINRYCETRGLDAHAISVEVVQFALRDPFRIGRFVVRVMAPPAIADAHTPMLERVVRTCPVHHTLAAGAAIDIEVVAGATA